MKINGDKTLSEEWITENLKSGDIYGIIQALNTEERIEVLSNLADLESLSKSYYYCLYGIDTHLLGLESDLNASEGKRRRIIRRGNE